ncbi:MAG: hypothetical protein ACOCSL_00490 [Thermoplasmatota archaeon]
MKEKIIYEILSRRLFLRFVLVFSLFLFFITLLFTNIGEPEPSVLWYMSELFWTFWIGIIISIFGILLSIKEKYRLEGFLGVFIPLLYLYSLPSYAHEMVVVFDVYHVIPPALDIIKTGTVNLKSIEFPFSHIYYASNMMVLDLNGLHYARLFPTILSSLIVLFIYTVSRRISKNYALLTPLIFLSLNWYMEYHMCRQAFGVMLWTAFWITFFLFIERKNYRLGLLSSLLLISLIPSHPGILIIVSFNLAALTFILFVSLRDKDEGWSYLKYSIPVIVVYAVSFLLLYMFVPNINQFITTMYDQVILGGFKGFSLGGPSRTSLQYGWVNKLRMAAGAFQSIVGLMGLYVLYKQDSKRSFVLGAWFLSCYLWLFYSLTHKGFLIERSFLTALIPSSILIPSIIEYFKPKKVRLRKFTKASIIVIMITFLLIVPITKNSIDTIETPTDQAFQAGRFAQKNFENRVFITDTHQGMFRYLESTSNSSVYFRARTRGHGEYFENGMTFGYPIPRTDDPSLPKILFVDYINNYFQVRYGDDKVVKEIERYEKEVSNNSSNIYSSGDANIYFNTS